MYIIDNTNWETGKVLEWKDKTASDELELDLDTLRDQRKKLELDGYISVKQNQHSLEITVHNWINPREHSNNITNPRVGESNDPETDDENEGLNQGCTQGLNQGCTQGLESQAQDDEPTYSHNPHVTGSQVINNSVCVENEIYEKNNALLTYFSEITKLNLPKPGQAGITYEWWEPIGDMLVDVDMDIGKAKETLSLSALRADEKHWNYANLKGLLKTYRAIIAEQKRGVKDKPKHRDGLGEALEKRMIKLEKEKKEDEQYWNSKSSK
jgi:hypothetical protein